MKVKGNYAGVSTDYIKKMIDKKSDMVLVDSRPKRKKYDKGHIPTAISISDSKFNKLKDQLPQDKSKTLVFYCGGFKCKLSHKSAARAITLGYTNVKVFAAGYPAWKKAYGASASKSVQIKSGAEEGSIDIAAFKKIITEKPDSILLIDVRDPDEFETGSFKTAVNIPTDNLEKKIASLSDVKPVVFICSTGARSGEAYYMVKDLRPKFKAVYYLEAELTFNKDGSYKIAKVQ
jgi:rhodanese-related sulfurtransferase